MIRQTVCGDRKSSGLKGQVRAGPEPSQTTTATLLRRTQITPRGISPGTLRIADLCQLSYENASQFLREHLFALLPNNFFLTSTSLCLQFKCASAGLCTRTHRVNLQTAHESSSRCRGLQGPGEIAQPTEGTTFRSSCGAAASPELAALPIRPCTTGQSRRRLERCQRRNAAEALHIKELTSYAAGSSAVVTAYDIVSRRRCLAPNAMSVDRIAILLVGVGERARSLPGSTPENLDPRLAGMPGGRLTSACPPRGTVGPRRNACPPCSHFLTTRPSVSRR